MVDPDKPPEDPPPGVRWPMVWRLAHRLSIDHVPAGRTDRQAPCATCDQPWPCYGRRLAERGLEVAWAAIPGPGWVAG